MDFRDRQRAVRQDARSLLETIRAERMERRAALGFAPPAARIKDEPKPEPAPAAKPETLKAPPPPTKSGKTKSAKAKSAKPAPLAAEDRVAKDSPMAKAKAPAPRKKTFGKPSVAPATDLAPMKEAVIPAESVRPPAAKVEKPARKAAPKPRSASIDALPGIGPGMIWRLNRLGVATFADLAGSDVARLRQGLGRLHRLAPLDHWIAHAVNATAEAAVSIKRV
jgi:predicted flap endonuclease-1-like 5' DNA nuclease